MLGSLSQRASANAKGSRFFLQNVTSQKSSSCFCLSFNASVSERDGHVLYDQSATGK